MSNSVHHAADPLPDMSNVLSYVDPAEDFVSIRRVGPNENELVIECTGTVPVLP